MTAQSGGFNFDAAANLGGTGASQFNFSAGGVAQFTGGTADANAVVAGRKYKKAVRRKPR